MSIKNIIWIFDLIPLTYFLYAGIVSIDLIADGPQGISFADNVILRRCKRLCRFCLGLCQNLCCIGLRCLNFLCGIRLYC